MAIFRDFAPLSSSCVALGNFDGVHTAHSEVLSRAVQLSLEYSGSSSVALLLEPKVRTEVIESDTQAEHHIKKCGIEHIMRVEFDTFSHISAHDFFYKILLGRLSAVGISCGFDFRFGKGAVGDVSLLRQLCDENNIALSVVSEQTYLGEKVSSGRIREALRSGDIELVNTLLGRPYSVDFEIKRGFGIGKTLGFPTVNQYWEMGFALPREGVYITSISLDGKIYPAATGVTRRPTFDGNTLSCETTSAVDLPELYGKQAVISFYKYLFEPRRYDSGEELAEMVKSALRSSCDFFEGK